MVRLLRSRPGWLSELQVLDIAAMLGRCTRYWRELWTQSVPDLAGTATVDKDLETPSSLRSAYAGLSIIHPDQIKPVRRRDLAARRPIARGKRGGKIVGAPFALADMYEGAYHRAHLVL
jgi:hypothetical protein